MEIYILSKNDLSILNISKCIDYEINLDEETNSKSTFTLAKNDALKKGNYIVINGLYKQFLFVIDEVNTDKSSNISTVTALDISNIFDRKVIEKDINTMQTLSIEQFIANTIMNDFVNSDDTYINIPYIDIYFHTNTQAVVATNSENGIYNFHTFLINCRQSKNIYTDFKFENKRLKIDIRYKEDSVVNVDTTVAEIVDYTKTDEDDITAKVQVLIRENNSEYDLYLKTDRTTTENKADKDRASGKIEAISVDTADKAREEALNVFKGNTYNHLVEFKIAKTSKLMDVKNFYIGRQVNIKTEDTIYNSYISAITIKDENFVYFKSGNLRITLLDKLKKDKNSTGNKLDVSGGIVQKLKVVDKMAAGQYDFNTGIQENIYKTSIGSADTRNDNQLPNWYRALGVGKYRELKLLDTLSIPHESSQLLGQLETIVPLSDSSGGCIVQKCVQLGTGANAQYKINKTYVRYSIDENTWGPWFQNFHQTALFDDASNVTYAGQNNYYYLSQSYFNFDMIYVVTRADWNNKLITYIPNSLYSSFRGDIAHVEANPTSWAAYGTIWLSDNNRINVGCTATYGDGVGISVWRVYGINYL